MRDRGGSSSSATHFKANTHHTVALPWITLLCVCVCVCVSVTFSPFSHFSEHFFSTPLTVVSAASTCPSSCPWGLIPQHQFVLEEDRGLAFIHPSAAPNSNRSDLLSVWHLTPGSLQPIHLHAAEQIGNLHNTTQH